jgi:hypothetical protein
MILGVNYGFFVNNLIKSGKMGRTAEVKKNPPMADFCDLLLQIFKGLTIV